MKKRKWPWIVLSVLLILGVVGTIIITAINDQMKQLANTDINSVDLTQIENGVYEGTYTVTPISVVLEVTINDHRITQIVILKHDNGQGKPAEVILSDVIRDQSLDVDVISGATYSSKAILLAIEDALNP